MRVNETKDLVVPNAALAKNPFALRRPCSDCPFRTDVVPYLTRERVREIAHQTLREGKDFLCHKTLDYDSGTGEFTPITQACAGMVILCEHMNRPTTMMQIADRLGWRDKSLLDMAAPVFRNFKAMFRAQRW